MSRISRYFFPERSHKSKLPLLPPGYSSEGSVYGKPPDDNHEDLIVIQKHGLGRTKADAHRLYMRHQQDLEKALNSKRKRKSPNTIKTFWRKLRSLLGL